MIAKRSVMMTTMNTPTALNTPLLITTGEPSGIGMDIVLSLAAEETVLFSRPVLVTACLESLKARQALLKDALPQVGVLEFVGVAAVQGADGAFEFMPMPTPKKNTLYVIDIPCAVAVTAGVLDPKNAPMVGRQLTLAHELAAAGAIGAIITAPIAKSVMNDGGVTLSDGTAFTGHTEFFMQACGLSKVVMMLANATMKVALVTTHIPLKKVAEAITFEEVTSTITITHEALVHQFGVQRPRVLVCGLNPHAGEDGHLGDEEKTVINPALAELQSMGMDVSLALPADTIFTPPYLKACDVIIAMYHDQGLAPLKSHGFGDTVNVTLGLPYIRTSVDHGTALSLAGTGKAKHDSLKQALTLAVQMAEGRASS